MMLIVSLVLLLLLGAGLYLMGLAAARMSFHDEIAAAELAGYEIGLQRGYAQGCEDMINGAVDVQDRLNALPAGAGEQRRGIVLELN